MIGWLLRLFLTHLREKNAHIIHSSNTFLRFPINKNINYHDSDLILCSLEVMSYFILFPDS